MRLPNWHRYEILKSFKTSSLLENPLDIIIYGEKINLNDVLAIRNKRMQQCTVSDPTYEYKVLVYVKQL